jgi:hypothetical protein
MALVDTVNEMSVVVSETGGSGDTEAERPGTLGTEGVRLMQDPKAHEKPFCTAIVTLELAEAPTTMLRLRGLVDREKNGTAVPVA